ncbi:unnamed protein product, partial [Staurois parvus]
MRLSLGKDTGPHDPLLPGGPMSCQSTRVNPCFSAETYTKIQKSSGISPDQF